MYIDGQRVLLRAAFNSVHQTQAPLISAFIPFITYWLLLCSFISSLSHSFIKLIHLLILLTHSSICSPFIWHVHGATGRGLDQRHLGGSESYPAPKEFRAALVKGPYEDRPLQPKIIKVYSWATRVGRHFFIRPLLHTHGSVQLRRVQWHHQMRWWKPKAIILMRN